MRIADVGDYADARLCRPGKAADLAEVGHSHFNDGCLVAVLQPEQVLGRPTSLLKFPWVFRVAYWDSSTQAIISLVVVFPTLPVMPTNVGWNFSR